MHDPRTARPVPFLCAPVFGPMRLPGTMRGYDTRNTGKLRVCRKTPLKPALRRKVPPENSKNRAFPLCCGTGALTGHFHLHRPRAEPLSSWSAASKTRFLHAKNPPPERLPAFQALRRGRCAAALRWHAHLAHNCGSGPGLLNMTVPIFIVNGQSPSAHGPLSRRVTIARAMPAIRRGFRTGFRRSCR